MSLFPLNCNRFRVFIFLFSLIVLPLPQAGAAEINVRSDSTRVDTTAVKDSIKTAFIPSVGSILSEPDTTSLSWTRFIWSDARYPGDLLEYSPGIFLRELGEPGQPHQLTIDGLDWRHINFNLDGQPLSDPVTGAYILSDIPIEFTDHIEIIRGPGSFLYGANGTAATVNFVTRQYDTNRPVTKIRFMQGPYEHLLTDGLYTQNIARGLNVMVGFLRQVSDGRYLNAKFDFWNLRSRIRYNISERLNIVVSDFYSRSVTGVNGGVSIDSSLVRSLDVFQGTEAIVRSDSSGQTHARRDLSGLVVGKFFSDSAWTTRGRIYYSTMDRDFTDPESIYPLALRKFSWNIIAICAQQDIKLDAGSFLFGVELEQRAVSPSSSFGKTVKNRSAWFGKAEVTVFDLFTPAVFGRGEKLDQAAAFSFGFDTRVTPIPQLTLEGGFSLSHRFPTFQETNWISYRVTAGQLNLLEKHSLVQLGASFRSVPVTLSASASSRTIENAIVHRYLAAGPEITTIEAIPDLKIRTLSGLASVNLWKFIAAGTLTFTEISEQSGIKLLNPKFILTGELAYRDLLFNGALDARVVVRSRYMSKHQGLQFLPAQLVHFENPDKAINAFSTLDLSGVFRIGDAFINITWENVLNKRYFITPSYPMLDRNVKIGLNWIFLD